MSRVVILQDYIPDYRVSFFRELRQACHQVGIDLVIAAGLPAGAQAQRGDAADDTLPVQRMRQFEFSIAGRRISLRRIGQAASDADLLILEQARRNLDAYLLLLPRWMWPAPRVAMWGHGRDFVSTKSPIEAKLAALLTSKVDHFFAYTQAGADFVSDLGVAPARITTVRNTVDTHRFQADLRSISDDQVDAFRRAHHVTDDEALLYVGGLDESKRIDFLLEAADLVAQSNPRFRLLVVGDGILRPLIEGSDRTNAHVVYLGRLTGRDKAVAFRAASALAIPGRVGLVAVESIASGKPILTTDWPYHAPEFGYLTPGHTVLVSADSVNEFANLMSGALQQPDHVRRASVALRELVPEFNLTRMVNNFREGIEVALDANRYGRNAATVTHVLGELRASGAEMMTLDAASWFATHGVRFRVIATGRDEGAMAAAFRARGIEVVHVPFSKSWAFLRQLRQEVASGSTVHVHTERASFWVCLALRARRARVARSIHSVFRFRGALRLRRLLQRQLLRLMKVTFVSVDDQVRQNEQHRFWLRTRVIQNFAADDYRQHRHPGLTTTPTRLVSVGNCAAPKNHEAILRALSLEREIGYEWLYAHVGAEDESGSTERDLAHRLGLFPNVRFTGRADPIRHLMASDVFLMPSHREGLGIAALEAISLGMPALLADSPGLRAFKEAPGIWWCSTEPSSIAEQLGRIRATPPAVLMERADAARSWVLETFSREKSLQSWLEIYRVARKGPS